MKKIITRIRNLFEGEKENFYTLFIGLDDKDEHRQMYDTNVYIDDMICVLRRHKIAFTINKVLGGYIHEDGIFVRENTLILLIRTNKKELKEILHTLCEHFNQESIMYFKNSFKTHFYMG